MFMWFTTLKAFFLLSKKEKTEKQDREIKSCPKMEKQQPKFLLPFFASQENA